MSDTTFLKQAPILAISPFFRRKGGGSNYDQMTGFFISQVLGISE